MQQRSQQQRRCSLQVPILNAEIVSSAFTQGIYLFDGMVLLHLEFEIFNAAQPGVGRVQILGSKNKPKCCCYSLG